MSDSTIVGLFAAVFGVQALQFAGQVWMFRWLRSHDQVLTGLPGLLERRDEALIGAAEDRFRRATFEEFDRALERRADERARTEAAVAHQVSTWAAGASSKTTEGGS